MNRISVSILLAGIAALHLAALPRACAQETAASSGLMFRLGMAINRAILAKPRSPEKGLDIVNRVHYATNVYPYEGRATVVHDEVAGHGLFIHWNLDDPDRRVKPGHALAE